MPSASGERRKPQPNNRPGYIRVDTVHQGDLDGHKDIPQRWAAELNDFHRLHTNPYHNYHRPCLFSETVTDPKGKKRKRYPYRLLMTPYDKLKSLPQAQGSSNPDSPSRSSTPSPTTSATMTPLTDSTRHADYGS